MPDNKHCWENVKKARTAYNKCKKNKINESLPEANSSSKMPNVKNPYPINREKLINNSLNTDYEKLELKTIINPGEDSIDNYWTSRSPFYKMLNESTTTTIQDKLDKIINLLENLTENPKSNRIIIPKDTEVKYYSACRNDNIKKKKNFNWLSESEQEITFYAPNESYRK